MKTYTVTWLETRQFKCSVKVVANSEDEAYDRSCDEDPDTEEETMKTPHFDKYVSCEESK